MLSHCCHPNLYRLPSKRVCINCSVLPAQQFNEHHTLIYHPPAQPWSNGQARCARQTLWTIPSYNVPQKQRHPSSLSCTQLLDFPSYCSSAAVRILFWLLIPKRLSHWNWIFPKAPAHISKTKRTEGKALPNTRWSSLLGKLTVHTLI